ncbi:uncharacterized protein [Setaria viridis]|uniref:uncharacterized protein n=1 Tax=Setaria viridis TaxID=4556 RepID=UPI001493C3D9|nr:uncharacterized protein LOC117834331 [Setaria viridis]
MAAYCNEVRKLKDKFDGLELNHVARRFDEAADELAKVASDQKPIPDDVFVSDQYKPSIRYQEPGRVGNASPVPDSGADLGEVGNAPPVLDSEANPSDPEVMEIDANPAKGPDPLPDWRALYLNYLIRETLLANKTEELYKRSYTSILQRCIPIKRGNALIQDIHAGVCGHHAAPRTLVGNTFRQGFYWPTAVANATHAEF